MTLDSKFTFVFNVKEYQHFFLTISKTVQIAEKKVLFIKCVLCNFLRYLLKIVFTLIKTLFDFH